MKDEGGRMKDEGGSAVVRPRAGTRQYGAKDLPRQAAVTEPLNRYRAG